jgi:hypothetical protein
VRKITFKTYSFVGISNTTIPTTLGGSTSPRPCDFIDIGTRKQRDDPNSARGLNNNFASDRGCDSTTTTRLPLHHRLHRADHAAPDKS